MHPRKHSAKPIGDRLLTLSEAAGVFRLNPRSACIREAGRDRGENHRRTMEIQTGGP